MNPYLGLRVLGVALLFLFFASGVRGAVADDEWEVKDIHIKFVSFDQDTYVFEVEATYHQQGANAQTYRGTATVASSGSYTYAASSPPPSGASESLVWERAASHGVDVFEDREVRCWSSEIRTMLYSPGLPNPFSKQGYSELSDWVDDEQEPIDPDADPLEYEPCRDCQADDSFVDGTSYPYQQEDALDEEAAMGVEDDLTELFEELGVPEEVGAAGYTLALPVAIPGQGSVSYYLESDTASYSIGYIQMTLFRAYVRSILALWWSIIFVLRIIAIFREF